MAKFITPVKITPASAGSWQDCDVSAYVPNDATGVILHITNTSANQRAIGWRKNGSTDDLLINSDTYPTSHYSAEIGLDSNKVLEIYVANKDDCNVFLIGYYTEDAVFFTNRISKTPASTSWQDVDISANTGGDTAIGAIFEVNCLGGGPSYTGFRKNGSTDSRALNSYNHFGAVIGVDANEICEVYKAGYMSTFYLVGYITKWATFNTNATDLSLDTTDAWTDLSALNAKANAGYFEVKGPFENCGWRKNGSAEDIYMDPCYFGTHFVCECDSGGVIEGKIDTKNTDFFLVGYSEKPPDLTGNFLALF